LAQVTGGPNFDIAWEEWSNAALRLVREAADTYARAGADALAPASVSAAFLSVVTRPLPTNPFFVPKWPVRWFDGSYEIPPAAESFNKLITSGFVVRSDQIAANLDDVIRRASTAWADGDPESPATRDVHRELLAILWADRLVPRPPTKAYPRGT
jgi:hypothetical protein